MDLEQSSINMETEENPAQPQDLKVVTTLIQNLIIKDLSALSYDQIKELSSATSRTHQQCQQVIDKGGISFFIGLLTSQNQDILEAAFNGLGNIAIDTPINRLQIINHGGLKRLVSATKSITDNLELYEIGVWAISMVCRQQEKLQIKFSQVSQAIEFMCWTIAEQIIQEEQNIVDCFYAIQGYVGYDADHINFLIETKIVPRLFEFLNHPNVKLIARSLSILGKIAAGSSEQMDLLIENGIFGRIYPLLNSPQLKIRKEVCWIFSNISAGTMEQVMNLFSNSEVIKNLLVLFENDCIKVGHEICYIFANLASIGEDLKVVKFLEDKKICSYYIKFLFKCESEQQYDTMSVCLKNLICLLEFGQKLRAPYNYSRNPFVEQLLSFKSDLLIFIHKINNEELKNQIDNLFRTYLRVSNSA